MKYLLPIAVLALTACTQSESGSATEASAPAAAPLSVASVDLTAKAKTKRWYTEQQLREGRDIYQQYCAGCHGKKAESTDQWRTPDDNGNYPPPPLNGSAHAWHHPLKVLDKVIADGGQPLGGVMPAWKDVLTEDQRLKAVASFQHYWSDEVYELWLGRERSARQ